MTLNVNYTTDLEVKSERTQVDRAFFNRRFKALYDELARLDSDFMSFGAAEATLVQLGLDRMNETLSPMLTTLQSAAELGFLTCRVIGENHSLVGGEFVGWHVTEGADLFTPTHFLLALDETDSTNWGILSLDPDGWHATTGELSTHVVFSSKTQTSSAWQIAAHAGVLPAMEDMLEDAQAARDAAQASQAQVASDMVTVQGLIGAIQAGPVASVAGKTGAVTLVEADIGGLVTDLAAKATISYVTTQTAGKQNQSAKLDTLINLVWAANKLIYSTSASTLSTLDISDFIKTLLDDANASAAQTTLGISTFIKTLLDDADAATARATLGVAATPEVPTKANLVETLVGTDDTKFVTPLDGAGAYSKRSLDRMTMTTDGSLDAASNGKTVVWTKATAGTITLSQTAAVDTECMIIQEGAGQITFAAGSGGTRASRGARYKSNGQYSFISAVVMSNSTGNNAAWRIGGDLVV
jgi:hypothetical protein